MSQAKTAREVLIASKWILENVGWCQETFYQTKSGAHRMDLPSAKEGIGCACMMGSILLVNAEDSIRREATDIIEYVLTEAGAPKFGLDKPSIAVWNDATSRTKKEVIAMLSMAIKAAPKE